MTHLSPALTAYLLFLAALLGGCVGSFLNCAAWRLAHGESVLRGRSHCSSCGHQLGPAELLPVLSWVFLKGKCRHCGAKIPLSCPLSELAAMAVFVSLTARFGLSWTLLECLLLSCVLLTAALCDLEAMIVPDRLHLFGAAVWLAFLPLQDDPLAALRDGLLGGFCVAGGLLLLVLVADKAMGRETMGGGDLKLLFVTGLFFGWAGNLLLLITACVLGLLFGLAAKARGREFPFVPAIAAAAWLVMLFGEPVLARYFALF